VEGAYRIEYAQKKIFSISQSHLYCCPEHVQQSALLQRKYNSSLPHSRIHAKRIDLNGVTTNPAIDDLLSVLAPTKSLNSALNVVDITDPPPVYSNNGVLSQNGAVAVKFESGLPVPLNGNEPAIINSNNSDIRRAAPSDNLDDYGEPADSTGPDDASAMEVQGQQEEGDSDVVYHKRSSAVMEAGARLSELQLNDNNQAISNENPKKKKIFTPRERAAAAIQQQQKLEDGTARVEVTKNQKGPDPSLPPSQDDIAAQFATMNALKEKYLLSQQARQGELNSTEVEVKPRNKFTDGSLLPPKSSSHGLGSAGSTSAQVGKAGRRPGQKTVSWGQNEVQSLPSVDNNVVEKSAVTARTASVPSATPSVRTKSLSTPPPVAPKRPTTIMLPSKIVERTDTKVLPVSSIITKTLSSEATMSASTIKPTDISPVIGGAAGDVVVGNALFDNDARDHWEDAMDVTAEVKEAARAASMSIEGYVSAVKSNFSVSPATTLKNLSHSPFYRGDGRKESEGDDDHSESEEEQEENENEEEGDKTEDDMYMESYVEMEGEQNDVDDDVEEVEEIDGSGEHRSLFLLLWTALDDLFGSTPESAFDLSHNHSGTLVPSSSMPFAEPDGEVSRPMVDVDKKNAHSAVLKLLQTGIQTAENVLDLFSAHLQLADERAIYQSVKGRLLKLAGNVVYRRMNLAGAGSSSSSRGTPGAIGSDLHTVEWTVLGLLVIDAIVVKKGLGNLRSKKVQTVTVDSVSRQAWDASIEHSIASTLKRASKLKVNRASSFREGDLHVLREFFAHP